MSSYMGWTFSTPTPSSVSPTASLYNHLTTARATPSLYSPISRPPVPLHHYTMASLPPPTTAALPTSTTTPPSSEVATATNSAAKGRGKGNGKGSGKRKTTDSPTPRAPNWANDELKGALRVAPTHWGEYRGSRTNDKSQRKSEGFQAAFVAAVGPGSHMVAQTRTAVSLDRNLKDTRTKFVAARAQLKRTGLSTSDREDILITFSGSELFSLFREALCTSSVANESTGREPVVFGAPATLSAGAVDATAGGGGGSPGLASHATAPGSAAGVPRPATGGESSPTSVGEAAAGGVSGVEDDSVDKEGDSDSIMGHSDEEDAAYNAVEILAAAEKHKNPKKAKKVSTSAAVSEYLQAKNERERVLFSERHNERTSDSGQAAVSDNDIRRAVLDMIGAISEKACRQ